MTMTQETQAGWIPSADSFGARLALVRNHLRLNIKQAATRAGEVEASWNQWEKGRMPRDLVKTARKIADALGCDYLWLLSGHTGQGKLTEQYLTDYVNGAYAGVTSPARDVVGLVPAA